MTILQSVLAFIAAAALLTITPGVDTAMVLRCAAVGGARPAAFAAAGIALGCMLWGALVSVGLGALIAASPLAFGVLKWFGAAYLLWLGIGLILKPRNGIGEGGETVSRDAWTAMRRGLLTNLLNPKVGVFYVTFLPQFVPAGVSVAGFSFLLACIHVLLGVAWFALLIAATVPLGRWLARPRVMLTMNRLAGGLFVGFGMKLALTR
ncbi:LysE family translocator [Sphingomonas sp. LB-2]|uniref:LysE family translocator n=1 Tax=Sphingomonas caeni TaxID=2984949 RepID=UPI0022328FFE|nr:LysE family translocator [Sphingomonas caeni]MCW3846445.1 LysE family translocator [Sphingomonas caeni]